MSVKKIIRSEDIKIKNDKARSVLPPELMAPRDTSYLPEAHLQSSNVILVFVILSVCPELDALAK